MKRSQIPNLITLSRILLTIPVGWALLNDRFELALVLFAIAGISDGVDGFLAKHYGWTSWIGGILDPLADKLLLTLSFVLLGYLGLVPFWLVAITVLRDVVILFGALYYHFKVERLIADPRLLSKIHTTVQIVLVLAVVYGAAYGALADWVIDLGVFIVLATTLASGLDYVVIWTRRALKRREVS